MPKQPVLTRLTHVSPGYQELQTIADTLSGASLLSAVRAHWSASPACHYASNSYALVVEIERPPRGVLKALSPPFLPLSFFVLIHQFSLAWPHRTSLPTNLVTLHNQRQTTRL